MIKNRFSGIFRTLGGRLQPRRAFGVCAWVVVLSLLVMPLSPAATIGSPSDMALESPPVGMTAALLDRHCSDNSPGHEHDGAAGVEGSLDRAHQNPTGCSGCPAHTLCGTCGFGLVSTLGEIHEGAMGSVHFTTGLGLRPSRIVAPPSAPPRI